MKNDGKVVNQKKHYLMKVWQMDISIETRTIRHAYWEGSLNEINWGKGCRYHEIKTYVVCLIVYKI